MFSSKHGTSVLNFTLGDSREEESNLTKLVEEKGLVPEDLQEYKKGRYWLTGMLKAPRSTPKGSKRQSPSKRCD